MALAGSVPAISTTEAASCTDVVLPSATSLTAEVLRAFFNNLHRALEQGTFSPEFLPDTGRALAAAAAQKGTAGIQRFVEGGGLVKLVDEMLHPKEEAPSPANLPDVVDCLAACAQLLQQQLTLAAALGSDEPNHAPVACATPNGYGDGTMATSSGVADLPCTGDDVSQREGEQQGPPLVKWPVSGGVRVAPWWASPGLIHRTSLATRTPLR